MNHERRITMNQIELTKYEITSSILTDLIMIKKLIDQICNEIELNNLSLMQSNIYVSVDSTRATRLYVMEITLPDVIFDPNKPNTYYNSNEEYINKNLSEFLQHLLTVNQDEDYRLEVCCRKM